MKPAEPHVSICICTFRRPDLLDALLAAIAPQVAGTPAEVVVADNDLQRSAAAVLQRWAERMPVPLRALHVDTPNIALARNATVHAARGEWVVFVDDDEEPEPGWLHALQEAQAAHAADAVFGPVIPRHAPGTADWIVAGRFFERPRYPSGTPITVSDARTSNVLVRRSALLQLPGPFDPAYGRTGGSDTVLFRDLLARGAVFVWCDEARVEEDVPPARANLNWILRRGFRGGQTFVRAETEPLRGWRRAARTGWLGGRAAVQLLIAAVLAAVNLPFSRARAARWLRTCAAQLGKLSALAGHRYQEYRP